MKHVERFPVSEDDTIYDAANEFLEQGLRVTAMKPRFPVRGIHAYDMSYRMQKGEGELTIGRQTNGRRMPTDEREEISVFAYGGDGFINAHVVYRRGRIDPESDPEEEVRNTPIAVERVGAFLAMYERLLTHPEEYPDPEALTQQAFKHALEDWRRSEEN